MSSHDLTHFDIYLMVLNAGREVGVWDLVRETLYSEGALRPRLEGLAAIGVLARHRTGAKGRIRYCVVERDHINAYAAIQAQWPEPKEGADKPHAVPEGVDKAMYKSVATTLDILVKEGRIHRAEDGTLVALPRSGEG